MLRKLLWALALCCLPWTARGQASSTFDYRYWFDNDDANARAATASGERWHIDADLSGLDNTLHRFYFQVKDTAGVWSSPVMRLFLKYAPVGLSNNTYYWFDTNSTARTPLPAAQGKMQIDVSQLIDGIHDINIQNFADVSSPSNGYTAWFLKQPVMDQLEFVYWLDNQQNTLRGGKFENGIMMLDVKDFDDGFHILYLQAACKGGQSVPVSRMFIKVPQTDGIEYMTCLCTVDGQQYKQERVPSSGGIVNWDLDVSGLQPGVHRLQVQAITPSGAASNVYDGMFFRASRPSELAAMKCLYNIDGSAYKTAIGSYNDGLYHFDLDVAALTDGLHRLNYMMIGEDGTGTQAKSTFFVKMPVGGYGITSYKYWLNSNQDEATEVKLDKRAAVLSIVDLLPMPTAPIRSECFQFEVDKNGVPYVYAKNDLHFEFADASERVVDAHKQFVDYNVSQEVTDITPLESGVRMYMEKPGENEIRWFSIDVERGDSLTFKLGQAATLQVLAADGTEVYASQGAASVKTDGCRVHADGRYYVAVHDVTAQTATNIALDYRRINKYAVISHTPKKLGLTDCEMVMTLYGNGFDKLTAACLKSNTQTLNAHTIVTNGYADAVLQFSVHKDSLTMGNYDLQLTFTDSEKGSETLTVANAVALEAAKYGKVQLRFEDKRVFTRPHPVKLHIKNTGNVPYQMVPVTIAHDNIEKIEKFTFENFGDVLPKEQADAGARVDFRTDNLFNTGKAGRIVPFFIPSLEPGEEIELDVSILAPAHTHLNFYTWTGMPWSLYGGGEENYSDPILEETPEIDPSPCDYMKCFDEYKDMPCDSIMIKLMEAVKLYSTYKNPVTADSLALLGYKSPQEVYDSLLANSWFISGQGSSVKNKNTRIIYLNRVVYSSSDDEKEIDGGGGTGGSGGGTGGSGGGTGGSGGGTGGGDSGGGGGTCGGPVYFYFFPPVLTTFYICPGWVVETLTPGDPNDLIGYTHESGNHAMNAAMAENGVPYTIRFENDPEIATAAAHTIVVTNQLDKEMFDFSTYAPNSIKIGNVVTDLDGTPNFVKTIDMRPRLNVIAQVTSKFDAVTGKAEWKIESLDPMTMEPTQYAMDGVLPINTDGNGAGEICYTVKLRDNLPNGTTFENKASIVFDYEDAMETPVWSNMLDFEPPHSVLKEIGTDEDRNVSFNIEGTDEGAGIWQYRIYAQEGYQGEWKHVASISADSLFAYPCKPDTDYGFCVLAVDSAGNVEQKPLAREGAFADVDMGDVNGDGEVNTLDASLTTAYYLGKQAYIIATVADVNGDGVIDTLDATQITQMFLDAQGIAPETNALPRRHVKPKQTLQP